MKKITSLFLTLILTFSLLAPTAVGAASLPASLGTVKLEQTFSGIVPDNTWNACWKFTLPVKMTVTFNATLQGSSTLKCVKWYKSNGNSVKEEQLKWSFDSDKLCNNAKSSMTLEKGTYYVGITNSSWSHDAYHRQYSFKLTGALAGKVTLSKAAKRTATSAKLTWKKHSTADGYQIYRRKGKTGKFTKVASAGKTKTTYINEGLKTKTTYYYKVRAYKKISGKTYYSGYSAVKSVKL